VWYDGRRIGELSRTADLGSAAVARVMIGDNVGGRTYQAWFDDVTASQGPIA